MTFSDPSNIEAVLASGPHNLDGRTIDPKACNPRSMQKPKKSAATAQMFPKVRGRHFAKFCVLRVKTPKTREERWMCSAFLLVCSFLRKIKKSKDCAKKIRFSQFAQNRLGLIMIAIHGISGVPWRPPLLHHGDGSPLLLLPLRRGGRGGQKDTP